MFSLLDGDGLVVLALSIASFLFLFFQLIPVLSVCYLQGYVKRGLMNSNAVRIEGKIYDVSGTFL